jgi:autotransporter-associated beta strand protein
MKAPTTSLLGKFLVPLAFLSSAYAADLTWTGTTGSDWNTSTNWNPNATPTTDDTLTILGPGNTAGTLAINVNAASSAGSIAFTNTSATTLSNTSGGSNQTLTLGSALVNGLTTGSGAVTIGSSTSNQGVNVALGANQTWDVGSGGLAVINVISGAFSITKNGSGSLQLGPLGTGAGPTNTFSGGFTLNAGSVEVVGNNVFGSGTLTLNGGTLNARGAARTLSNSVTVGGDFTLGGTAQGGNALTLSGAVSLGGGTRTITVDATGGGTISGKISNGGFTKAGTSQLTLSNSANDYAGTTTIQNGILKVTSSGALGAGSSDIALGDATSIASNLSPKLRANGAITIARNITVGASNAATTGVYTIDSDNGGSAWGVSGNITLNQNLTVTSSTTGGATLSGNITSGASGVQTLTLNNTTGTMTVSGAVGGGTGAISVTKTGAGAALFTAANTYTGDTRIGAGKLQLSASGTSDALQNSTLDMNASDTGTLEFVGSAGTVGATFGGLKGTRNIALANTSSNAVALTVGGNGQSTSYSGVLSGAGSLIKAGSGVLTLSGANTYTGGSTLNAGTLTAANSSALGAGAVVLTGGTLDLNGASVQALNGLTDLTLTSGTISLTLTSAASFDQISGTGSFTLNGGTLDLTNSVTDYASTYQILNFTSGGTVAGITISNYDTASYTANLSNAGVLSFTAVPEPHEFALAIVGLLGVMVFIRRRNLQS